MKLALVVGSLDQVDSAYHGLYEKRSDGKYHLQLSEPVVSKSKLDEFRTNNIEYKKKLEALNAELEKFKDVDPKKAKEAMAKIQELEDKKMIDAGKLEELLEQRTERMRADFESQTKALKEANEKLENSLSSANSKLGDLILDRGLQQAVSSVGSLRKGAALDAINRGRAIFSLNENHEPEALDEKGGIRYGKDGKSPLTMEEWAAGLMEEASYLFEGSSGGGGKGGSLHGKGSITLEEVQERGTADGGDADLISGLATGEMNVVQ